MLSPEEKKKRAEQLAEQMLKDLELTKFDKGTAEDAEAIIDTAENKDTANTMAGKLFDKGATAEELQELNEIAAMAAQIIKTKLG